MKTLGLFFFTILISSAVEAQLLFGIKGGLNLSDIVLNNLTNPDIEPVYKIKAGIHAGVFAIAEGESNFSLSGELLYSNKGVHALNRINLHYISVPILLRYRLNEKWIVEGGPEVSYLVTANSKYGNLNSVWDNKLDLGLDAGVQYQIGKIYAGLRFNAGFSSVIRAAPGTSGDQVRYLNRVAQLSLSIPLKAY